MQSSEYLDVVRRHWWIIAVACALGLALGFFTARRAGEGPERFEATHTLSVLEPEVQVEGQTRTLAPRQVAVFGSVGAVPERAAEALAYEGRPQDLADQVDVEGDDELGIVEITVADRSGERAAEIANTFGDALVAQLSEEQEADRQARLEEAERELADLERRVAELGGGVLTGEAPAGVAGIQQEALTNQYQEATNRYQQLVAEPSGENQIVTLERAVPEEASSGLPTSAPSRMAVFGLLGALLGFVVALVLDRLDTRLRTREEVEEATGFPIIGEIPRVPRRHQGELLAVTRPSSPVAQAYRKLRTMMVFSRIARDTMANGEGNGSEPSESGEPEVIMVTSPGPYEGKTTTVAQLAAAYAESGRSVLVVDCDLRRPRQHRIFGIDQAPGLSDVLTGARFGAGKDLIQSTSAPGVSLVPAGTALDNPTQLFSHAQNLVAWARGQADLVLIDTPPFLVASDAEELMTWVDAVMVVVRVHQTTVESAERGAEELRQVGAPVAGVVVTGSEESAIGYGSYYYYSAQAETRRRWPFSRGRAQQKEERRARETAERTPEPMAEEPVPAPVAASAEDATEDEQPFRPG